MLKSLRIREFLLACFAHLAVGLSTGPGGAEAGDTPPAVSPEPAHTIRFNRDIRPILSDKCFRCHGPDKDKRKARLRFDRKDGAFRTRRGRASIVPGDPEKSEVYVRISAEDEDDRMPPPDSGKSLTDEEIATIRKWIEEGAEWEGHWAFIAPRRPEPPPVERADWPRNPIDVFVLAKLEAAGLSPSPEADRRTLIRRVTFDLTGLPPTVDEVEAFLRDTSPQAYEKVVDRLLQSPCYGEQMARYWLDAARYGDTHGLHLDNYREIWPYRDWVIRAFNRNLPWDQFTIKNLAGDLLPGASVDDQVASGFNRAHVTTNEGGSIAEEVYVRNVIDRVSTVGTVFLGLTTGCAVCHDHKFDPVTQKDFYSMFAFFNNLDGNPMDGNSKAPAPVVRVPSEDQQRKLDEYDRTIARLTAGLDAPRPELDRAQADWEAGWVRRPSELWKVLDPILATSSGGATLTPQEDHSLLASGKNPDKDVYTITVRTDATGIVAIRLEALTHPSLAGGTNGRAENGNAVLSEFEAEISEVSPSGGTPEKPRPLKFASATADHSQSGFDISAAIDGKVDPDSGWATQGHERKEGRTAVFVAAEPFGFEGGTEIRVRLRFESKFARHTLGRVRLAVSTTWEDGLTPEIVRLLTHPETARADEDQKVIRDHFRRHHSPEWKALEDALAKARTDKGSLESSLPTTLVMKERAEPRPAYILRRGQYDQPEKDAGPLDRAVPDWLPPFPEGAPRNRLGFAEWLVQPSHPLLARVTVNRFWSQCFGRGIVETSEDFGSQGAWPTHPDLLDWLAVDFRESDWNVKRLMKMIVTSATYRQRSWVTPELRARDPQNLLLARGPRFRLDAEELRDQALALSGLLVRRLGGPPVKPPQPAGLWKAVAYVGSNTMNFKKDDGDEKVHRRSIYTFWKRTAPPPQMSTLDAPSREACTVRRERTNTPLQALLLLNDPQYVEAARYLGRRGVREGGETPRSRAEYLFTLATLRPPAEEEVATLVSLYQDRVEFYRQNAEAARELISVGETPSKETSDAPELAAWTLVANAILNLDEVITKE